MPLLTIEKQSILICFNETTFVTSEGNTMYRYDGLRVNAPYEKHEIINDIIRIKYSQESMEAIINNHLLENESEDDKAEFDAMQEWRANAKAIAKEVMDELQPK